MDVHSREQRSYNMSRITSRHTKPELRVRSFLHRDGYRFTVNAPNNKFLPGKPDLVLPKYRTVVFIHGCFWHGHKNCRYFQIPKTRTEWWRTKILSNIRRDEVNIEKLNALGWRIIIVWECALRHEKKNVERDSIVGSIGTFLSDPTKTSLLEID